MGFDPQYTGKTGPALGALAGSAAVTASSTAAQLSGTSTTYNYNITLTNTDSSDTVYIGRDNTVTGPSGAATCGVPVLPQQTLIWPPGDISALWAIAPSGSPVLVWGGFNLANP